MVRELTRMKDSGIEWIGEIPEDWEVVRLKDKYKFEKGRNANKYTKEYVGSNIGDYPVYSGQTENKGVMGYINSYEYNLEESIYTTTVGAKVMTANMIYGKFTLSQNCVLFIRNSEDISNRYVLYALGPLFNYKKSMIPNYMQPSLRIEDLKSYIIYAPNIDQQEKIANFLDQKVGEIDRLIEKTKEVIGDYKSYKQSLITETVTKGLRKDVALKDSGIEWIGEIPEHWEVVRGKYILTLLNRKVLSSDEIVTCFRDGEVTLRSNRRIDGFTVATKEIGYQGIEKDDIVVHGMDGFAGAIGISDSRGKASPVLNVMDTKESKKYLVYYLRNLAYKDVFLALSTGIRERSTDLRWNKIAQLCFVLPPLDEQKEIADYLDEKCGHIDRIIETKEGLIKELEAYKKSLIYETVTGKREVD